MLATHIEVEVAHALLVPPARRPIELMCSMQAACATRRPRLATTTAAAADFAPARRRFAQWRGEEAQHHAGQRAHSGDADYHYMPSHGTAPTKIDIDYYRRYGCKHAAFTFKSLLYTAALTLAPTGALHRLARARLPPHVLLLS